MIAIYKRELQACFHSFIGTLFIGATLFLLGIYFSAYNLFMGYSYIGYALSSIAFLFLVSIPVLTMRILAEERKQKTDQLILTSPVSVTGIVVGKFLALATIWAIPILVISIYPVILSLFGTVSFSENYLAILGFFLYGLACIAIGIFVSSLTESQVIAAVITFALLFIGYVMSSLCHMISSTGNLLTKILSAFDMVSRFDDLLNGSLHVSSIIYYLSVVTLFLIFTVQAIQKRRYQISTGNLSMSAYSTAVVAASTAAIVIINLIVNQLPSSYTVFDVTSQKLYSLTDETKEFISDISEEINIYVIVNEKQADQTLDTTLQKYEDLNSNIKVSYVDPAVNPKFFTQYTDSSISSNSIIVESQKRSKVINYSDIYQTEFDYSTYSQSVTGYDGEGQLTSAIAYVTSDDMPRAYILEGHGERTLDASFQKAVEKENVEYETINLLNYEAVPEDAQCVIINAPTEDLSADDAEKMLAYMEKGGNVLLVSTYTGKELDHFNQLLAFYGVEVTKGLIIETDQNHYYQNPFYLLPDIGYDTTTDSVYNNGGYLFAPYAQGLSYTDSDAVTVTSLLSASEDCYVRDNIEKTVDYSMQEGDIPGPFDLGLKCIKATDNEDSVGIIFSSEHIFTEETDSMVAGNNLKLFSGVLGEMVSHESSISIPVKSYQIDYLTISQNNIVLLAFITVILIPFVFLIGGFVIWFRRRKR